MLLRTIRKHSHMKHLMLLGASRARQDVVLRCALALALACAMLLAACGGSDDTALAVDNDATAAGPASSDATRAQALATSPAAAPAATATWTRCAVEGGVCTVPTSVTVRYGANGTYAYKTVTGSVGCTNNIWGDPLFGIVKACDYTSTTATPAPAPTPAPTPGTGWVNCASEGGVCTISGTRNVRYGANGSYYYKTVTGQVACNNNVWGDPIFGTVKACQYDSGGTVASPSPTPTPTPTLGTATLGWSASTDPRVLGYRIYWGTAPGNYTQARGAGLAAGTATSYVVRSLPTGRTYYFAVTAYDSTGTESAFSAEASKVIP
jgi:hypothetical protein